MAANGSAAAVNELSRSKQRYRQQDQLLAGFYHKGECTAKEVAAEYLGWMYEAYADAPKRATDLASDKLGYLALMGNRVCRRSGKDAHVYQITERGIAHLVKVGLVVRLKERAPVAPAEAVCVDDAAMRVGLLQAMRGALK